MQDSPRKIVIIRFSSIGDIVLTTPVYRCLRKKYPAAEIHVVVKEKMAGILASNPNIDKIHTLGEDGLWPLIKKLKSEEFDFVIDLHNNLRSTLVKLALQKSAVTVSKMNWRKWLIVNLKSKVTVPHIVLRYMQACESLGLVYDGEGLDHFTEIAAQNWSEGLKKEGRIDSNYVIYAVGGQFATKRLPLEKWLQLAKNSEQRIYILGGKDDEAIGLALQSAYPEKVTDWTGRLTIDQSAELIKTAAKVYTNDTGMMHIAAAYNKPIEVFWGNTSPSFGMYPFYPNRGAEKAVSHEVFSLSCRPCSKIGYKSCPKGHFKCMNLQKID